ncbi:hypothetical protein GCM10023194_72390 [Planotetraspora phitsanulokensis]|uniref:DUF6542 domain-containing protein n=1 Tax=Planotetraspora phitsanulokensis TaxID=575192 RepID=A0A8J3U3F4_9ACTN|nr:DUF6542 domain-containing protein [Planotetraspora phitsanulokensis]GII37262.1 hypothetical protein Pph01_22650 [Planotetraspora phitsanulokensis]
MTGTDQARLKLTARGAVALLFIVTLLGQIVSLPGPAFVAGCIGAALLVQPRDLLPMVVTPPLVFFAATTFIEIIRSIGADSMLQTLGLGLFTAFSSGAPWLFGGSALALGIAWPRGLPDNVRDLRHDLAAKTPGIPKQRESSEGTYAPEPEGYFEPRVYGKASDD